MDPKKVWGIIIIILGVLSILYAFNNYSEMNFLEKELISTDLTFSKLAGKSFSKSMGLDRIYTMVRTQKYRAIIFLIVGIMGCILGTLMIKDTNENKTKSKNGFTEDILPLPKNNGRWKL